MPFYLWIKQDLTFLPELPPMVVVKCQNHGSKAFKECLPAAELVADDKRGYSYFFGRDLKQIFDECQEYYDNWAEICRLAKHPYDWVSEILFRERVPVLEPPQGMSWQFFEQQVRQGDLVQVGGEYLTWEAGSTLRMLKRKWLKAGGLDINKRRFLYKLESSTDYIPPECYEPKNLRAHILRDGRLIKDNL